MNVVVAAFSQFVVIRPSNEARYPFVVQVHTVANKTDTVRVRVTGPVDDAQKSWLIICRQPLLPAAQNFRHVIWGSKKRDRDIVKITRLHADRSVRSENDKLHYPTVEAVLTHAEMQRAYIYIDYPSAVYDGGYYHSIDLAYYLDSPKGKKSSIRWEDR